MPRPIRIIAPVLAAVAIALAGATSVLAASGNGAASSLDLAAQWCFDDAPAYLYCFDVDGKAQFVDTKAGSAVTITERFHTVVYKDGAQVGESTDVSLLRSTYQADGTVTTQEVVHTKAVSGDETCRITVVWRQADYEMVVDHWSGGCA